METESKYGSTVFGKYFLVQELQIWQRCDSDVTTDMLCCVVNKNIKELLIEMKTIFL